MAPSAPQSAGTAWASSRENPAHADAVAAEVGCLRFRPEEVAAASAHPPHPVDYARAEALGQLLIAALRAPAALPHEASPRG